MGTTRIGGKGTSCVKKNEKENMKEGKIIDFKNYNNNDCLRVVTLFSGYGSQELALQYLDIEHRVIANSDINKNANKVYDVLHKTELGNLGDITKIDENNFPECDLLTFSFPCTSVSQAGKQEGIKKGTASGLLFEVERILTVNKPKYLMMENVKNLLNKKHKPQFKKHLAFLKLMGYAARYRVFNAFDFSCGQNRERVIMIAELDGFENEIKFKLNDVDDNMSEKIPMRPFIEEGVNDDLYINCDFETFVQKNKKSICKQVAKRNDVKYDQAKRIYSIDGASPTLTKTSSTQIMTEDGRVRYVSAREAYRLMGIREEDIDRMFTASLTDKQHKALAGNSICVPVLMAIFNIFFQREIKNKLWENQGLRRAA
jgi:DNA-cytosine methyltransferase